MLPAAPRRDDSGQALAIASLDDFVFGRAPRPVFCGRGVEIGRGTVIPEINFTLPAIDINETTWPEIRRQYHEMMEGICQRAVDLDVPSLLIEFETLPPMTVKPAWGLELTEKGSVNNIVMFWDAPQPPTV